MYQNLINVDNDDDSKQNKNKKKRAINVCSIVNSSYVKFMQRFRNFDKNIENIVNAIYVEHIINAYINEQFKKKFKIKQSINILRTINDSYVKFILQIFNDNDFLNDNDFFQNNKKNIVRYIYIKYIIYLCQKFKTRKITIKKKSIIKKNQFA